MKSLTTPTFQLSEPDIRAFLREKPVSTWKSSSIWLVPGILGVLIFGFVALNAQAFLRADHSTLATAAEATHTTQSAAPIVTHNEVAAAIPSATPLPALTIPNETVSYADFDISAPVHWDLNLEDTKGINTSLESGVVHIAGTAKPGEKGNVVIFGHSSNYPWAKGDYKTIFAPILKAQKGQMLKVAHNNVEYTYKLTDIKTVSPTNLAILNSIEGKSTVTLVTCTPLGTSKDRLALIFEQVTPGADTNSAFDQKEFSGQLPGDR